MPSELRIFVPVAIRTILERLAPRIEAAADVSLIRHIDLNPAIPERIASGEAFDIGLTNPGYARSLVRDGHADGGSHCAFCRVPLALGRRAGMDAPVRREAGEIRDLLGAAQGIAYTGAGTSGRTYLDAMNLLGLSDAVMEKSLPMDAGEPVASVARGEVELAVAPLTTILSAPGIAVAAIFPEGLGTDIDISVFLSTRPSAGARQVLGLLTSPAFDAELSAMGAMRFTLP